MLLRHKSLQNPSRRKSQLVPPSSGTNATGPSDSRLGAFAPREAHQLLLALGADRHEQPAPDLQLLEQRLGHRSGAAATRMPSYGAWPSSRACRRRGGSARCGCRVPSDALARARTAARCARCCTAASTERRQHGGLVAAARADLQHVSTAARRRAAPRSCARRCRAARSSGRSRSAAPCPRRRGCRAPHRRRYAAARCGCDPAPPDC